MNMLTKDEVHRLLEDTSISERCQLSLGSFEWKIIGKEIVSTKLQNLITHETRITGSEKNDTGINEIDIIAFQQLTDLEKYNDLLELVKHVIRNLFPITDTVILTINHNRISLGVQFSAMTLINKIFDLTDCKPPILMVLSDHTIVQSTFVYYKSILLSQANLTLLIRE